MTTTGPWIKLWRDILHKKIGFLIRRYGHEVMTFWIGVLTNTKGGVLAIDEDILADMCFLETKRYEEIRGLFVKRGLIWIDEEGIIRVQNWQEYQGGGVESSSTERVRRFRERNRAGISPASPSIPGPVTPETLHETDETLHETEEGEEEREEEGEGERAGAREEAPPPRQPDREFTESAHAGIAFAWFKRFSRETAVLIGPAPPDILKARDLLARLGGDVPMAHRAIEAYFDGWRGFWWAISKATRKHSDADKRPEFSFFAFADHVTEVLAGLSQPRAAPGPIMAADIICPVCGTANSGRVNMVTCFTCHFDLTDREDQAAIEEHRAFMELADSSPRVLGLMNRVLAAG